jgi:hypothetical protein
MGSKSVRGWEIMPRTPIRHGFGDPLKPLVARLATPDELTFPVSTVSRNRQNYPHDDLAGLRRASLDMTGDAQRA